jgi:hypothetical protein
MSADHPGLSNPQHREFSLDSNVDSDNDGSETAVASPASPRSDDGLCQGVAGNTGNEAFSPNGLHDPFIVRDDSSAKKDIVEKKKEPLVTWMSLPHKRQLIVLTAARLSEPLVQTSLQSYMFYQLKSFDKSLPDSVIASQAGVLQGSFTAAQFLTAMMWGRIADSDWGGRKMVLLIGLLGSCMLIL